ncbi:LlaJI family restriction endonuclease [Acinetobacter baumannii]|uniref:LlaJI family restriction endonuclease n=1 Tax=Acinetobacter TaxID=469 RepID=UPI000A4D6B9C|nr:MULTISPECIES: LlaJI family restriction endonuclease [Acinetobacter]MDA3449133.1 LlaJI family restriction endonuclease [Acinetobacter sp. AOR40_HL]MDA3456687.1 LlaJI family restriction endonuclease [Acinetobacter sp. AOR39_HL]MDA3543752.1 LlaJI family restriction endonuclease [Acinetobacter sp. AOR18_HL]MDQ9992646.1 LlaJI family restriction endonuclease [Acinetobacter pittii]MEB3857041.1 LlaJI family restriction endonuclease [Acinetobacter pittii]
MMEYRYFEDKKIVTLKEIPDFVIDKLKVLDGIDVVNQGMKITFCGVIIFDGCTYCFTPAKSFGNHVKSIGNLIKAIHFYKNSVDSSLLAYDEDEQGSVIEEISLTDIFEIVDLYFNVGILRSKTHSYSEKGRTNWSKTVNREFPVFTSDDVPVYLDLQKYPISVYQDDLISSIHCEIILDIFKKFHWLDDRFNFVSEDQLAEKILFNELDINQKISLLKQRLHSTFVSLEIRTLQLLIRYLERIHELGSNNVVIGIRKFHYVWEFLLKNIFHDVDLKINSLLPIPQYQFSGPIELTEISAQKGMRLDIFIKDENRCWVIDSKYYTATGATDAPGWSDLVKQFFYIKAIKLIYPELKEIKNIFIFPGVTNLISKIQMTYRDESKEVEKLVKLTEDFVPIECLYLDPNDVIEKYLKSEKVYITDYI